jgi:hypothetical protein
MFEMQSVGKRAWNDIADLMRDLTRLLQQHGLPAPSPAHVYRMVAWWSASQLFSVVDNGVTGRPHVGFLTLGTWESPRGPQAQVDKPLVDTRYDPKAQMAIRNGLMIAATQYGREKNIDVESLFWQP